MQMRRFTSSNLRFFSTSPSIESEAFLSPGYLSRLTAAASSRFVPGTESNGQHRINRNVRVDRQSQSFVSRMTHSNTPNITAISGTNLFVTEAPRNATEATRLMADLHHRGIGRLVTFATSMSRQDASSAISGFDSFDYLYSHTDTPGAAIQSDFKLRTGCVHIDCKLNTVSFDPSTVIEIGLSVKRETMPVQQVNATVFSVGSNMTHQLNDVSKQMIWDLYREALSGRLAVHSRLGVGRTGEFILTLELLRNFREVFVSPATIEGSSNAIINILNRIRLNRPGLVLTVDQFKSAVVNAAEIFKYILQSRPEISIKVASNQPTVVTPSMLRKG